MTAKKRISSGAPQNRAEASDWMARLQNINLWLRDIDTDLREASAKLKADAEEEAAPHRAEREIVQKGLYAWAEANRSALTNDGRTKTVKLSTGEVKWRQMPPKVGLRGVAKILEHLRENGLGRFIRKKEEIDKDAMLKEPELAGKVPGVRIGSEGETIDLVPYEDKLDGGPLT